MIKIPGSKPLFATTLYEINMTHAEIIKLSGDIRLSLDIIYKVDLKWTIQRNYKEIIYFCMCIAEVSNKFKSRLPSLAFALNQVSKLGFYSILNYINLIVYIYLGKFT